MAVAKRAIVRLIVIYVRFSSDMQRTDSCDDQERKIREHLTRLGIDHTAALVIRDEAISGTIADRPGLNQLKELIAQGRVQIVAVDEQSRLTRGTDATSRIQDMVFENVRFISVLEQVDTERGDWHMKTQILSMHNNMAVRDTGHRVRRGQEGRVLDDGSAGDFCFGYESYFIDGIDAQNRNRRGPKPKKGIRIMDAEAAIVRQMFGWFLEGWSIGKITVELNARHIDKGHRATTPGWHHQQVRRALSNPKYVGRWTWGKTTTMRNSKGKKKQVPISPDQIIVRDRPELRIIEQPVWERAQQRLAVLHEKFGWKEHQRTRGPKPHYTELYPKTMLGGLLYCGACGARLCSQTGGIDTYYGCPNHRKGTCRMIARVPMKRGERVLLDYLSARLNGDPEWLDGVLMSLNQRLKELSGTLPHDLEEATAERGKLEREIRNLTDALAKGDISDVLMGAIRERKNKLPDLDQRLAELQRLNAVPDALPSRDYIALQLRDLVSILLEDSGRSAQILRTILGKVHVHELAIAGKKRGYLQFRFRLSGFAVLSHVMGDLALPLELSNGNAVDPEVCLDVTAPTSMDKLAPRIAEMRARGASWKEISRATGLAPANAAVAWKRLTVSQGNSG